MKAVFCGNGTLLIQCAEAFLAKGGMIAGILSDNPRILDWAKQGDHAHLGSATAPALNGAAFDYLFSVANLTVLPDELIDAAAKGAINFHDGPLPAYSGLNVPAWALMAGETSHGVTWHEMTTAVDQGQVLKTAAFDIDDDDTTFSLNSKAYEAGLASFSELLEDLFGAGLQPVSQTGDRGWFAKAKRPEHMGVLDLTAKAADLSRLIRGLDHGAYGNPLTAAKLWTGTQFILVGSAEIAPSSGGAPGKLTAVNSDNLHIGVADGELILSDLRDVAGNSLAADAAGLSAGAQLPALAALDETARKALGKAEPAWRDALEGASPLDLPYPRSHGGGNTPVTAAVDLPNLSFAQAAGGFGSWAGNVANQTRVTIGIRAQAATPHIADAVPLTLDLTDANPASVTAQVEASGSDPMAADLVARLGNDALRAHAAQAMALLVTDASGSDAEVLGAGELVFATNPARLIAKPDSFDPTVLGAMAAHLSSFLKDFANENTLLGALSLGQSQSALTRQGEAFADDASIADLFAKAVAAQADKPALEAGSTKLSFAELDAKSTTLAYALSEKGATRGTIVGLCLERSADLIIAQLAILKTGAAYLPLDPNYPADRIAYMIEDSAAPLIVASESAATRLALDPKLTILPSASAEPTDLTGPSPSDLAYLIYTSGSTGNPKGVMVTHRNASNFFTGMDEMVPLKDGARLLGVTSVSFDISVLEIFWTLTRGATLVLQTDGAGESQRPDFSLFYFASEAAGSGHHAYRLLIEGAKFADENGFKAIWNPERHFHAFGGLYPNPAVSLAAVAGMTKNVQLRGGSCVLPLHHPVRAAEDWSLLDNLSNGRAGMAIASGWQPNDFIMQPANFGRRKEVMDENIDVLRSLWAGEKRVFPGHDGKDVEIEIHPKPVQDPIPLWITAAGNPETFAMAAKKGCGVLTHLLGQTFEEVAEKIKAYRVAWREAGHAGTGTVTLMLHTFVAEDEDFARETAREPMKQYLKSATNLIKEASWSFPTFKEAAESSGKTPQEIFEEREISDEEMDALLAHAFDRYYRTAGLFGTPENAKEIVRNVASIGVDEIACLIDFGIDTDIALEHLPHIKGLMDALDEEGGVGRKASLAEDIVEREISHLQCTPSMAAFLTADEPGRVALSKLDVLMVGGEAFPPELAKGLRAGFDGALLNMYGPTETTIWSSVARLDQVGAKVPLGAPITNTKLSIRADNGAALPDLVAGELWIGGDGVTNGYWQRPDLTADRFVQMDGEIWYRTGDLVRAHTDGTLEFLGRIDNQVKIRGHRIELGEIEAALASQDGVNDGVVKDFVFGENDTRLIGFVTGTGLDATALRASLAEKLPDFMVPSQILTLQSMPLTPNGKIDRKALPSPLEMAAETGPQEEASDGMEADIAAIWAGALGLPSVSVTDNFFDLGGHSLLIVQVQRQLEEKLQRPIAITDVFRFPTVRSLAAFLSDGGDKRPSAASRGAERAKARLAGRRGRGR